ncbi:SymE family type I addiction module toxin [Lelliottia wanjuensis]|uniref:SymE family type I addiction module toxin n=1 Tax=Lelliottia wanjuensis TaxID=3050585 RepID=UPI003306E5C7
MTLLPNSLWLAQAGFTDGMPIKIRVMLNCVVITTQTPANYGAAPRRALYVTADQTIPASSGRDESYG